MLEINLSGDIQTGKTQKLIEIAAMHAIKGDNVMFVCHNEELARHVEWYRFTGDDASVKSKVTFCGPHDFVRIARSSRPQVIIFDELEMFPPHPQGNYIAMAKSRLQLYQFGVLAYSTYSNLARVKLFKEWMSKPWYKRVWYSIRGNLA